MQQLTENLKSLYENIKFYDRYKNLSDSFRSEDRLKKVDKKLVIELVEKLNYQIRYLAKEKFFQIKESSKNYDFYYHLSLRNGLAEIIFGGTNKITNSKIGGVIHGTCKLIEISNNKQNDGYILMPAFSSIEELALILKESLSLYEDFKKEVLKLEL